MVGAWSLSNPGSCLLVSRMSAVMACVVVGAGVVWLWIMGEW